MSFTFQPRARAALTPTSGGRFPPPSAAALTSGSKVRRGFTPRSASRTKPVNGSLARPKLTPQQQLEIIQRLETGNFRKGEGLSQFYEEFSSGSNNVNKLTCKQNLFSSFASVDPIASSTRNYGNGLAGSMESLISVSSSVISSNATSVEGMMDVTSIEAPMMIPAISHISEGDDDYETMPDYIKAFDRLLSTREKYCKMLEDLAEARCAANFARLLPQDKIVTFFKSLERVQKIIQKFLDGNASENMKLFMPVPKTKGSQLPVIHCNVENHTQIINAFYKLSEIMESMDSFIDRGSVDIKLEARMESFKDLVGKLEAAIKIEEKYSIELKDMVKKTELIDLDENIQQDSEAEMYDEPPSP